jgi:hypothetical protein
MEKEIVLDLKTLEYVDFMFKLYSDNSCNNNGYINLKRIIEEERKSEHCLNKEDIESLGFVTDPSGERYFELNDYQLNLDIHPVYNVTIFTDKYGDSRIVFQGTIKNKSELKQVLKMIGVIE